MSSTITPPQTVNPNAHLSPLLVTLSPTQQPVRAQAETDKGRLDQQESAHAPTPTAVAGVQTASPKTNSLPHSPSAGGQQSSGRPSSLFGAEPYEWYIHVDPTMHGSHSYGFSPTDGKINIISFQKEQKFNAHSETSWQLMEEANFREAKAQRAKLRGYTAEYEYWHHLSQPSLEHAIDELKSYIESLAPGETESLSHAYANLASCFAMSGKAEESLQAYSMYEKYRPGHWTKPYGHYCLASIFMIQGDLDNARKLLLRTVSLPTLVKDPNAGSRSDDLWGNYNLDPEYNVISWALLAHIEELQGNSHAREEARANAKACLLPIANNISNNAITKHWVLNHLLKMGVSNTLSLNDFPDPQ